LVVRPRCWPAALPSLNTISVGTLRIPSLLAVMGASSMSSFHDGREALAGAAPGSSEIYEHGLARLQNFIIEIHVVEDMHVFACHIFSGSLFVWFEFACRPDREGPRTEQPTSGDLA
jgi:hypothetical protein